MSEESADHSVDDEPRRDARVLWERISLETFIENVFTTEREDEETRASVDVTVLVGGSLLTGQAISFPYYLELFAEAIQVHGVNLTHRNGATTRYTHDSLAALYRNAREGLLQADGDFDAGMLFLKNAQVLANGELESVGGLVMAIPRSQVQGWALGSLAQP